MSRKLTRDGILVILSDGGTRLLTFVANLYLANVLGPKPYGIAFLGLTILTYAMWPADLGLYALGVREMAKPREKREVRANEIIWLQTLLGLGGMILTGIGVMAFVSDITTRNVALLFLIALIPSLWQMNWYYHGSRRYGQLALLRYFFSGTYLIGIWLFVDSPGDLLRIPLIYTIGIMLAAIGAVIMKSKGDSLLLSRSPFNKALWIRWKEILRLSTPIGFGSILAQTVQMIPPILLAAMYDESRVGIFGAASRLAMMWMIVDRTFFTLFLPRIANIHSVDPERLPAVLRKTFRIVLATGLAIGIVAAVAATPVVDLLLEPEYKEAALPLALMSWFVSATLMTTFFSYALVAAGFDKAYFQAGLLSAPIAAIVIVLLTWQFGVDGCAAGVGLSEGVMAFLMYRKFRDHLHIKLW